MAALKPAAIRRRSFRPVRFGLVASSERAYRAMETFLVSPHARAESRALMREGVWRADDPAAPGRVEIVLYSEDLPCPHGSFTFFADDPARTVAAVASAHEQWDLALARAYPRFRSYVSSRIIRETARENAVFAIATALPDAFPSLAEIPWSLGEFASDAVFITVNQLRMAFQLAAAHAMPVGYFEQGREILGIAGGAFGWRALARELAGKIPFGGGLAPKGVMAYSGTYAVGTALRRHYE